MTVYFKSLPILNSPSRQRGLASSTHRLNVNAVAAIVAIAGCTHAEPPAPDATPWRAEPELVSPGARTAPRSPSNDEGGDAEPVASTLAPPPAPAASVDPATLPQTHDVPSASGPAFDARVRALWNAIVADDPDAAMPFFFPLPAYRQVKDVADPEADWKRRLVSAYKRDVHALHARLGDGAAHATLVSLDVPSGSSRWVDPGEEWNRLGYYRVFGSKLRYAIDGRAGSFDVKSLISWRGEWYVVHLGAIR